MSAANLFTRKITGLDYRVWLSLLVTCLACLGLVGYKKIKANSMAARPCSTNISIAINGKDASDDAFCYLSQMALFRINAAPGEKVKWDFGDGSDPVDGPIAPHTFRSENLYTVTATIDGSCEYTQDVMVKVAPVASEESPEISIHPDSTKITAGSHLRFSCASNIREEAYEWQVLETKQVQTTQTATFAFPNEGIYTVQLMLNNDPKLVKTQQIEVGAKPQLFPGNVPPLPGGAGNPMNPPVLINPGENPFEQGKKPDPVNGGGNPAGRGQEQPKPDPGKAIEIAPETFKSLLQSVLDGKKEVSDLFPYLDYKETTTVQKGNDENKIKLSVFCRKNAGRKIEKLEFIPDDKNSIQTIKVELKRRGPFGLFGD